MALEDALGGLKSYFNQDDLNDPRVNSALRQKIALQMMSGKKGYPKTVGEGLTAIGDALGDIGMANRLARSDVAAQQAGAAAYGQQPPAAAPQAAPQAAATPSVFNTGTSAVAGLPPVVARDDTEDQPAAATPSPTGAPTLGPSPASVATANNMVRNRVTDALVQQAAGGPQPNPTLGGDGSVSQLPTPNTQASPSPTPPTPTADSNIRVATADPGAIVLPNVRPAPPAPLQIAQNANPPARYDYVMPKPGAAPAPPKAPQSPEEQFWEKQLILNQGNPYAVEGIKRRLQDEVDKRLYIDKQNAERYQNQLLQERELEMRRQEQLQERAQRATAGRIQEQGVIAPPAAQTPLPGAGGVDPRLGTPNSPQRTGIPSAPPVPPGISPAQHAAQQAPILTQASQAVTKAEPEFQRSIELLRRLGSHPGREWGVGPTGRIAGQIPGTSAFGFHQLLNQLNGKEFLEAYQSLRGGGQISNVEGGKAQDAIAAINAAQSKDDFDTALLNLEKVMRSDLELAQRKSNRPVTAWQKDSNDNYAPDIGERGMRKGVAVEYIGGNPADDRSYRRVQ